MNLPYPEPKEPKRVGTHFHFEFQGEMFTGLRKFTDRRIQDGIARRLAYHLCQDVEVGYIGRTDTTEEYEARWFDGERFHQEKVVVLTFGLRAVCPIDSLKEAESQ